MRSMQCNVEFEYQLSICSGTKENQRKTTLLIRPRCVGSGRTTKRTPLFSRTVLVLLHTYPLTQYLVSRCHAADNVLSVILACLALLVTVHSGVGVRLGS
jgi:hypothetical protein